MKHNTSDNFKVNEEGKQFELYVPGGMAFVEYYREGEKIFLTHTETPEAQLIERTLQCAKDNGLTVVPLCSYVAHYVNEHPEWIDILSEGYQM
jgi:predicted GNAT family acetyltransferase